MIDEMMLLLERMRNTEDYIIGIENRYYWANESKPGILIEAVEAKDMYIVQNLLTKFLERKVITNSIYKLKTTEMEERPEYMWVKKLGDAHYPGKSTTLCGKPMLGNNYNKERRDAPICAECKRIKEDNNLLKL